MSRAPKPASSPGRLRLAAAALVVAVLGACAQPDAAPTRAPLPSILLVTLDTTRADSVGLETERVATPHLEALAAEGAWFTQAYATAPTTLPSHASMLTGLYPAEHGVHLNGRVLRSDRTLLSQALSRRGYRTAAFVSAFPLAGRFGLARGFDRYDDDFLQGAGANSVERPARATTDRALEYLGASEGEQPLFLWVHYYDPHAPYEPPEPWASRSEDPYLGEIAAMDEQLGRLLAGFRERVPAERRRILVVGDHGESRGEHGELLHGNLLYQGVVRVPLVIAAPGVEVGATERPVSVRRVFDTVLVWAGEERESSLLSGPSEPVLMEAMKPYLQYGWQPQVAVVHEGLKAIRSGGLEIYDVASDATESEDLSAAVDLAPAARRALRDYPVPSPSAGGGSSSDSSAPTDDERRRLAALGYASFDAAAARRADAPSPRAMTHLFADLDRASALFVEGRYVEALPLLDRIQEQDPANPVIALRAAVAASSLGRDAEALERFADARRLGADTGDVDHYLGLHHLRAGRPEAAEPLLERVLAIQPERDGALRGLAAVRRAQGRLDEARELLERLRAARAAQGDDLEELGHLYMAARRTGEAIEAFESARGLAPEEFRSDLELGVLHQAAGDLEAARDALSRVPPEHPEHALALFKRAQVSVLLAEADRLEHLRRAWRHGTAETRAMIERERLFAELLPSLRP